MMRIVVGRTGNDFEIYRDNRRLAHLRRSVLTGGKAAWQWHVRLTREDAGNARNLGEALDAIERAHAMQLN